MEKLEYRPGDKFSTIATVEPNLQTVHAEKFVQISENNIVLEGIIFDRDGMMYCTSTSGHGIFKINPDTKEVTKIVDCPGVRPAALKIHKNGKLYAACVSNETMGGVFTVDPDGSNLEWIIRGYSVDDICFDDKGGFYFTHFVGSYRDQQPYGGVYYVNPEHTKLTPFATNMCQPNGVALSTDGSIMWITEFQAQKLHRFVLETNRACVPYTFTGWQGPDSCEIDGDDNLYVACAWQGRFMVFNFYGSPIGQILIPGRENGHNLLTTHSMIRPGTQDVYMTVMDSAKEDNEGSWIYRAGAFAGYNENQYQFRK